MRSQARLLVRSFAQCRQGRCSDVGFSCVTRPSLIPDRGFGAKGRCKRPYERHWPQQPTGRNPDPAHGIDRAGLRMIPFVRQLTWKLAQIDDDDYANKDQNSEYDKSERIQRVE